MESYSLASLNRIPYIGKLRTIAKKEKTAVFLVGGILRDVLLKRKPAQLDFDFAVEKKAMKVAKEFSSLLGKRCIVLDDVFKSYRVVLKKDSSFVNYDFTEFRGKNLEEDILKRDFTINTLCINIEDLGKKRVSGFMVDKTGAARDLKRKIVRGISEQNFKEDPLRILRAASLSALLEFKIDRQTTLWMKRNRTLLKKVSSERVREELFKILSVDNSWKYFQILDGLRIPDVIIREIKPARKVGRGGYHHLHVWKHSLETLRCFETLYLRKLKKNRKIIQYLKAEISAGHNRQQLLKLACLFHDLGKPRAYGKKGKRTIFYGHEKMGSEIMESVSLRLKMSWKETEFMKKVVALHLRPGFMIQDKFPTPRAIYRFGRDAGSEALALLFLFIADLRATRGRLVDMKEKRKKERIAFSVVRHFLKEKKDQKARKKLIDGFGVMKICRIPPSVEVGRILRKIDELQALGQIRTVKQAQAKVREIHAEVKGKSTR